MSPDPAEDDDDFGSDEPATITHEQRIAPDEAAAKSEAISTLALLKKLNPGVKFDDTEAEPEEPNDLESTDVEDVVATGDLYVPPLGWVGNVFCPTGEGGGIDPSCPVGGASGGHQSHTEAEIRDKLSSPENRDYPYQKYRQVKLPDELKLDHHPIAEGVPKGEMSSCYVTALGKAKAKPSHQLYVGVLVSKKDMNDKEDPPEAVKHAWTVVGGKIHDATLGSKRAEEHYYIGEPVDPGKFANPQKLQDYITSKMEKGEKAVQMS